MEANEGDDGDADIVDVVVDGAHEPVVQQADVLEEPSQQDEAEDGNEDAEDVDHHH